MTASRYRELVGEVTGQHIPAATLARAKTLPPRVLAYPEATDLLTKAAVSPAYNSFSPAGQLLAHLAQLNYHQVLPTGSRVPGGRWLDKRFNLIERKRIDALNLFKEAGILDIRRGRSGSLITGTIDASTFADFVAIASYLNDDPTGQPVNDKFREYYAFMKADPQQLAAAKSGSRVAAAAFLADAILAVGKPEEPYPTNSWLIDFFETHTRHISGVNEILSHGGWIQQLGRSMWVTPPSARRITPDDIRARRGLPPQYTEPSPNMTGRPRRID